MTIRRLKAIDLCCGAGGWAVAARGMPIEFVAVVDWNELCLETWRVNHQVAHPQCQRVQADLSLPETVEQLLELIGDEQIDIVLGGIPCEQVSRNRNSVPLPETKLHDWHRLIDQCFEIVRRLHPQWWSLEDVDQIAKHLPKPLQVGFPYNVRRINSKAFGPQIRSRTFVGVFPTPRKPAERTKTLGECLRPGPHRTVPGAESFAELPRTTSPFGCGMVGRDKVRVLQHDQPSPTVLAEVNRGSRQRRAFMTLDELGRRRLLSWQELARVQGFPDDYLFACGQQSAEAMIGRAIPVYVGSAILQAICEHSALRTPQSALA